MIRPIRITAGLLPAALGIVLTLPMALAQGLQFERSPRFHFDPLLNPGTPIPDFPTFPPTALTDDMRACLPKRLHPVSRQFLDLWLSNRIGNRTFRRFFHMPNSTYLPVGECLLRERVESLAEAGRYLPA